MKLLRNWYRLLGCIELDHLAKNNETYFSHMLFALKVSIHLSVSSTFFLVHSILPFVKIPNMFNLAAMRETLTAWHEYAIRRNEDV